MLSCIWSVSYFAVIFYQNEMKFAFWPTCTCLCKEDNPGAKVPSLDLCFEDFTRPDCDVKLQQHAAVSMASSQIIGKMTLWIQKCVIMKSGLLVTGALPPFSMPVTEQPCWASSEGMHHGVITRLSYPRLNELHEWMDITVAKGISSIA